MISARTALHEQLIEIRRNGHDPVMPAKAGIQLKH